jgi:hypothetical protein
MRSGIAVPRQVGARNDMCLLSLRGVLFHCRCEKRDSLPTLRNRLRDLGGGCRASGLPRADKSGLAMTERVWTLDFGI